MDIVVSPISPPGFGCLLSGAGAYSPQGEMERQYLRDLWTQHGLLVWRGGQCDPAAQIELCSVFGSVERHMQPETWVEEFPALMALASGPDARSEDNDVYRVDGIDLAGFKPWHSDMVHQMNPTRGSLLRAVTLPRAGGDTAFIDRIMAYEKLSDELKAAIEGLRVVYRVVPNCAEIKFSVGKSIEAVQLSERVKSYAARKHSFPAVTQPLVYEQPATGRKSLNLSPWFADSIEGWPEERSDILLQALIDHLVGCPAYIHQWEEGDLLLWDNWRLVHMACGTPPDCSRLMHRCAIASEWTLTQPF